MKREEILAENVKDTQINVLSLKHPKTGQEVQEAMRTKEELRLAVDMLNLLNSDDQVRDIALREILDDMERNSEISDGEKRGQRSLIEKMIEGGATIEQIAKMLKVDVTDVENMLVEN